MTSPRSHVLVVDDDAALSEAVAYILEVMDMDVTTASNGLEALALLDKGGFDLIVSDLSMPGLDGHGLIERLRARRDKTPILFLSGSGTVPDVVKLMKLGAVGFVEKPFDPLGLRREIQAILQSSRETARPPPQPPSAEDEAANEAARQLKTLARTDASGVLGRYQLRALIAAGGMGKVFRAHDPQLEREVAIKVLRAPATPDEETQFLRRFRREALALGKLRHPNVVAVHDFAVDEPTGVAYVVMELIEGKSLAEVMRVTPRLPHGRALTIGVQIARALAYVHENGIVHRDVKPENVILDSGDQVRLIDFGIVHTEDSSLTIGDSLLGSPSYLSPEAASAQPVDWRADQFSLATVIIEMLSGRRIFRGESILQTVRNVSDLPTPTFAQLGIADAPPHLEELLTRMHAKYAEDRVQDEAELVAKLEAAAAVAVAELG